MTIRSGRLLVLTPESYKFKLYHLGGFLAVELTGELEQLHFVLSMSFGFQLKEKQLGKYIGTRKQNTKITSNVTSPPACISIFRDAFKRLFMRVKTLSKPNIWCMFGFIKFLRDYIYVFRINHIIKINPKNIYLHYKSQKS